MDPLNQLLEEQKLKEQGRKQLLEEELLARQANRTAFVDLTPTAALVDDVFGGGKGATMAAQAAARQMGGQDEVLDSLLEERRQPSKDQSLQLGVAQAKIAANERATANRLALAQAKEDAKKAGQTPLDKLGADAQGKVGSLASGFRALAQIKSAISSGQAPERLDANTPVIGSFMSDNDLTRGQRTLAEVVGRLQSGGAINKDEERRFLAMGPRPGDSAAQAASKIEDQKSFLRNKLAAYKIKEEDLAGLGFDVEAPALTQEAGKKDMVAAAKAELARREAAKAQAK